MIYSNNAECGEIFSQQSFFQPYRSKNFDSSLPIGHSEKSLAIIMGTGFPLFEPEIAAIRWHMTPYRLNKQNEDEMYSYECAVWKYPLVTLISCSDTLCAKIIEVAAQWLDV